MNQVVLSLFVGLIAGLAGGYVGQMLAEKPTVLADDIGIADDGTRRPDPVGVLSADVDNYRSSLPQPFLSEPDGESGALLGSCCTIGL